VTAIPRCWDAEVVGVRDAGPFQVLTVSGAPGPSRPGQFAAVTVGGDRLLRRQMWLDRTVDSEDLLEVIVGHHAGLTPRTRGDRLNVIAPLGRPFSMPNAPLSVLLVGSGPASAALVPLAEALVAAGCRVVCLLLGEHVYGRLELRRAASTMRHEPAPETAEQIRGYVTDSLDPEPDLVYSAGSAKQIAAYVDLLGDLPHQVALDAGPICGTGVCQGCVLPVQGNDGYARLARICREGAVFHGHHILWAQTGTDFEYLVGAGP